jgi:predicted nucleic acid-binding protein
VSYLLDTNVISEARKPDGDSNVKAWLASAAANDLYLSVLVVGEIRRGVERLRRRDPAQAAVFETWLTILRQDFADRILPITTDIAGEWERLNVPDPVLVVDGLLAATAKAWGWTLVTRNTADLARTGVRLLNPFTPHA